MYVCKKQISIPCHKWFEPIMTRHELHFISNQVDDEKDIPTIVHEQN